jgi:enoyl-CoA hydratase
MSDLVMVETVEFITTITLNRPDKRNALNREMRMFIKQEMVRLNQSEATKVIILTGADPAFSAGVDFSELDDPATDFSEIGPLTGPFFTSDVPVIGAINGAAYTGGLELALTCNLLIASEKAVFADTHAKMGMMPGWGLSVHLPIAIGPNRARQMMSSCEPIAANQACEWGLVNEVVFHELLMKRTREVATAISQQEIPVIRKIGALYNQNRHERDAKAWLNEQAAFIKIKPSK